MPDSTSSRLLGLCLAICLAACLLAVLAETDIVTTATGVVRPSGEALPVQAPRDGRMAHWRVVGELEVSADELLGTMENGEDRARLDAVVRARLRLQADGLRLEALLAEFGGGACAGADGACDPGAALASDEQHRRERALEAAEREAALARWHTLSAERRTLAERLRGVARQQRWQQPECMAQRTLASSGRVAEVQWWAAERRCAELEALQAGLAREEAAAEARLGEQQASEDRRRAAAVRAWGEALAGVLREREALAAEEALLGQRIEQAELRAPASGRLDCGRPGFQGVWLRAGEVLCRVVPRGAASEVHADLPEHAREGIHPGQRVSLRVLALPWLRHGILPGRVGAISADTRSGGPQGEAPVYDVTILLEPASPLLSSLVPGMRAEADFHRGREPLWRWLLAPLAEVRLRAAREP